MSSYLKSGFFTLSILTLIALAPIKLSAGEGAGFKSGGQTLDMEVTYQGVAVPQNTNAANSLRDENSEKFANGTGTFFSFITTLNPWDSFIIYADHPPDAWKPPLPFYFSAGPQLDMPIRIEGNVAVFDDSAHLTAREYWFSEPNWDTHGVAWYCNGTESRAWEDWMDEAISLEQPYLDNTGMGVIYFLRKVHIEGIIGGEKMKALLEQVRAQEMSIQRVWREKKYGVFFIPSTPNEWENWIGGFYVWINMKNYTLERHQVDMLYGREICQYYNQIWNVRPFDSYFFLEWLPTRILDELGDEIGVTVTETPLDETEDTYIKEDQFVYIKGTPSNQTEPEEDTEES